MKIAQRCPVCLGRGNVPGGFYNVCAGHAGIAVFPGEKTSWSSSSAMEKCRSCIDGIIYIEQEVKVCEPMCDHIMVEDDPVSGIKACVKCGHVEYLGKRR